MTALSKPIVVCVAESADVRTIGILHAQLKNAFNQQTDVCLRLAPDAGVDLTFVQLIEAARRFGAASGRSISLSEPAPEALRAILDRGGFLGAADARAFWLHETRTN